MRHSATVGQRKKAAEPRSGTTSKRVSDGGVAGVQARLRGLQRAAGNQAMSALLSGRESEPDAHDGEASEIARDGLASTGRPLDAPTRMHMEARYGHDFEQVRLHTGEQAEQSAAAMRAKAYTVGHDIVFGRGHHAPGAGEGLRLLAHELAHVVQQDRGGAPAPSPFSNGPLELAAHRASAQAVNGSTAVAVAGAAAPGVMRQPEEEEETEASRRAKERKKTQQRKHERARAGKEESQLSREEGERELRALENSYRQPGAKQRSLKTKERDLKRFSTLLKRAGGTTLEKNKRQGAFDELQRTPTTTSGKPQTKHVAGGPQLKGQELRPGKDPYAQPDYSLVRRRKDGTLERVHVNLKSDQIDLKTPAKARATARAYVRQAIKNSRHLAEGEKKIIISFARTPSKEIQEEMKREFFAKGSPIGEVRFGTTTHKLENYKPPGPQPVVQGGKAAKQQVKGAPKKTVVKTTAPTLSKTTTAKAQKVPAPKTKPTKPSVQPPKVKKPKVTTPRAAAPKVTAPKVTAPKKTPPKGPPHVSAPTTSPLKVPARPISVPKSTPLKVRTPTVTTPKITTPKVLAPSVTTPKVATHRVATPKVTTPRVTAPKAPKIPVRGGLRGSGGMGGDRGAAGAAIVEAIAVPIINHYVRKHFADKVETHARELISKAIEAKRPEYEKLIEARRAEIEKAQSEGREVFLRVAVDTSWQDTDIGTVLTDAKVGDYQLGFEDGQQPKPYEREKPGGVLGELVRGETGTELTSETYDIALEGTDPEAKARRESRRMIDAILNVSSGFGVAPLPFEYLIIDALENNRSLDPLRDYSVYRTDLAGRALHAGIPAEKTGLAYWAGIVALLDGNLDQLIAAAKAKNIPLERLRAAAVQRRDLAGQSSDVGAGPAAAAYWSEIVRLIEAK